MVRIFHFQICLLIFMICMVQGIQVDYKDCGSKTATVNKVEVDPCDNPKFCSLKKGTSPKISVTFTSKENATNITAIVHGIVSGVPVPFPLPHPNACTQSGLTCPINAGTQVTYNQQLQVKSEYPSLVVVVKWELKDQAGKDLVCFMLKTRIVD